MHGDLLMAMDPVIPATASASRVSLAVAGFEIDLQLDDRDGRAIETTEPIVDDRADRDDRDDHQDRDGRDRPSRRRHLAGSSAADPCASRFRLMSPL